MKKSKKKKSKLISFFLWGLAFLLVVGICGAIYFSLHTPDYFAKDNVADTAQVHKTNKADSNFVKAVAKDSTDDFITFSNYKDYVEFDNEAGSSLQARYTGRRINIAVVGLDSRIGTRSNHADANHVLSILLDSGKIEIISVPRDTPADAGFDDSTGQNKLTVVRAVRGREAYLKELARITQLDQIHYYVEVTFSQVIGFLDFFGYKDPKSTLQVLRSRKGLGGDDYQRCYNQAQFIRQMILKNYHRVNGGIAADLLLRGALALLNTNLTYNEIESIIAKLNMFGFPRSKDDITIKIRPAIQMPFKVIDFTNQEVIDKLVEKIERFNLTHNEKDSVKVDVLGLLNNQLTFAERDTAKNPKRVISRLGVFFEQRAWMQVENPTEREKLRTRFENCLVSAYTKLKKYDMANDVRDKLKLERELFKLKKTEEKQ